MKITVSINFATAPNIKIENQYGCMGFARFQRIISTMKASGEMREDAVVVGCADRAERIGLCVR